MAGPRQLSFQRDAAALDLINFWDAGSPSFRWNEFAVDQAIRNNLIGPAASRVMSSLNVAIYDAMVAAWDAKHLHRRPRLSDLNRSLTTAIPNPRSPSYPSEHAVAAGAASAVLAFFFPQQVAFFNAKAEEAGQSRLLAGVQYPSNVRDGLELGRAVAQLVIARAQTDNSNAVFTGTIPQGACNWKGTTPFLAMAGTWRTWALTSGGQFRPGSCWDAKYAHWSIRPSQLDPGVSLLFPNPVIRATRRRTRRFPAGRRCWPTCSRVTPKRSEDSPWRPPIRASGPASISAAISMPGWRRASRWRH